jgi:hypothetical protein
MSVVGLFGRSSFRWGLGIILVGLAASASGVARLSAGSPAGCATIAENSIVESATFTPYEEMRSHLPPAPLNPEAVPIPDLAADAEVPSNAMAGQSLRWAAVGEAGEVYQYFLNEPISKDVTREQFMAKGGIELDRDPVAGELSFSEYLLDVLGQRTVRVAVGNYAGALTWADPDINGLRTHNLYWSDGKYNYSLIANRSAHELVNLGRARACS